MVRGVGVRRGLYVGRFQPPHKGHVHAVVYALGRVDELIIAIGSAQYSHEKQNPFTAGERFTMLRLALDEEGVDRGRYCIVPIPDTHFHSIWAAQVVSLTPKFEVVFTNDALTGRLLKEEGFEVRPIPLQKRQLHNATAVRERILKGESWEETVPKSVAAFLKGMDGVNRIRELARSDQPKP